MNYSVLMSVYYKEKPEWLRISLDSMMQQTLPTNDFVIVEDGPLTKELDIVIEEFISKYDNVFHIVKLEKNRGLGLALREGIQYCKNELVVRMDSDDYSVPERCEKLLSVYKNNQELDIIGSFEAEFEDDSMNVVAVHKVPESSEEIFTFMKKRCALLHPTVMFKKSAVIKSGNYRDVRLYEDYDLFMRMVVEYQCKAYNIQENLYYIRINEAFYDRRGGWNYLKTAVKFKYKQLKQKNISKIDFVISAGGQAVVCLMPNKMRRWFYMKFLR